MHGLSIYEIKMICHHTQFSLAHMGGVFFAFDQFSEQMNESHKLKYLSFSTRFFLLIIAYELKPTGKCVNPFVIQNRNKILHDIFCQVLENRICF